jgi:hypothetical protein
VAVARLLRSCALQTFPKDAAVATASGAEEEKEAMCALDRARDARELTPLQVAVKGCHARFAEESAAAACQCGPGLAMPMAPM